MNQPQLPSVNHPQSERPESLLPNSTPEGKKKLALLTYLTTFLPNRQSDVETKISFGAYIEDLSDYTPDEVAAGIRRGRKRWKYFPTIAELLKELGTAKSKRDYSGDPFHRDGPQIARGVSIHAETLWKSVCDELSGECFAKLWLHPLTLTHEIGNVVTVRAPTKWFGSYFAEHHLSRLRAVIERRNYAIQFEYPGKIN